MSGNAMRLHTAVCDLLCCDHPIVLAGMGGVARTELVAAVTRAGGFGFLGMVRESPQFIRSEIAAVREATDRPFGVGLVPAGTDAALFEAELDVCIAEKVHAVSLFWDLAADAVRRLRDAGILVVCQIGSPEEARQAEAAGAQVLIAQGLEAGGHVRGETTLKSLLPRVIEATRLPVLAAGGLTRGRDLAEVLAMGAQGAVFGTAFLATQESFAHDYHKQRILDATDTVHTEDFHINWPPGAPVRVLANSVTRGERGDPFASPRQEIGREEQRPIYLFSTDSPLRTTSGDLEAMALYAGSGVRALTTVVPAADRVRSILAEAEAIRPPAAAATPVASVDPPRLASPACLAAEAPDAYMGFADRDELAQELNTLLEAERAGARVAARLVADAPTPAFRALAAVIHDDEVRWSRALFAALQRLDVAVSQNVGEFYGKAMSLEGFETRLAFVNRGQGWVVRKLRTLLPRVRDDGLHEMLSLMLTAHERNIESAADALEKARLGPSA